MNIKEEEKKYKEAKKEEVELFCTNLQNFYKSTNMPQKHKPLINYFLFQPKSTLDELNPICLMGTEINIYMLMKEKKRMIDL